MRRAAALALLAACSSAPQLHYSAALLSDVPAPALAGPPEDATKLSLAEAFRLALRRSEAVSLAGRTVIDADIQRHGAWTEVEPNVRATVTETVQREVSFAGPLGSITLVPGQNLQGGIYVDQPLYRQDLNSNLAAAAHHEESTDAAYQRARQQLERDVAAAFINVVRARKLHQLATDAVDRATTQQQLAAARVKAGQALHNAELLADVDLSRAQRQEVASEQDAANADLEFQRLVGRAAPPDLELPPAPDVPELARALDLAMHRTDLVALTLQADQARAARDAAAKRRWFPKLDLHAQVQAFTPDVLDQSWNWQVLGVITVPLFQSGTDLLDLSLRDNDIHVADLQIEQQRKIVVEQVKAAALQMSSTARQADFANKQRDAALENYKLVDKQVRLGAITPLEVTNAQAVLTEAESASEVASMDHMIALYDYLFEIGTIDLDAPAPR